MVKKEDPKLHEVTPKENAGRDTISRYQAQFRAASNAALEILEGKDVDRVYCDYHDDFVVRKSKSGDVEYHFFQVKTKAKRNYQWSLLDIFGIYKRKVQDKDKIVNSFIGKLLLHTVNFKDSCGGVVFLTNIHFADEIEVMIADLDSGDFDNKHNKILVEKFNECFCDADHEFEDAEIKELLSKLTLTPGVQYLNEDNDFEATAREKIYKYSEIDLENIEAKEIVDNLVVLAENKSFRKLIGEVSESDLDDKAGIGINDLLDILSISRGAYEILLNGGDLKAIKSASVLQRKLEGAGASIEMVEFCCEKKIQWDEWYRNKRHVIPEYDLKFLQEDINAILSGLMRGGAALKDIREKVDDLLVSYEGKNIANQVTKELLLGGVFSALVRSESQ